jgi:hypothetical protein
MFNKLRFIATCALILISACVVLYFTHGQLQAQHSCFTKGTQISMANGSTKNIEDIIIGDEVFGFDEQTQTIVAQVVQRIDKPIRFHYVTVTFNDGSSLNMTEDHRVYSQNGWSAINPEKAIQNYGPIPTLVPFKIGDQILNLSGNLATATNFAYHYGPIQLYDLVNVSTTPN